MDKYTEKLINEISDESIKFEINNSSRINPINQKCFLSAVHFHETEITLFANLCDAEATQSYNELNYTTLFSFLHEALKFSKAISYTYSSVVRKALEIPELKEAILNRSVTINKAKKILSVLNPENQAEWIEKAKNLSQHALEKEVIKVSPRKALADRVMMIEEDIIRIETNISVNTFESLTRVLDLEAQRTNQTQTYESIFDKMSSEYLKKNDPLKKLFPGTKPLIIQVYHRDKMQCRGMLGSGARCSNRRFLHVHHLIPKSLGGLDTLDNLITLCSSHHRILHKNKTSIPFKFTEPSDNLSESAQ